MRLNVRMLPIRQVLILLTVLALLPAGKAEAAAAPAPDLTRAAGGYPVFCWTNGFPMPFLAYFQPEEGINLRSSTCKTLRRVMAGWRPSKTFSGVPSRSRLADSIWVLGHEMGHAVMYAAGEDYMNEDRADAFGWRELGRIAGRMGLSPWWRRELVRLQPNPS